MIDFRTKFMTTLGESAGEVLFTAFLMGALWSFIRFVLLYFFKKIGVNYFAEISESYKWIEQTLVESRAVLNADRACFYRCSNGKVYLDYAESATNKDIKIYAITNVVRNKNITPLPVNLSRKYFDWYLDIQKSDDYLEQFPQDLPMESQLRNNLKKYAITAYMSIKIKFGSDLYGVIIYTWSDVKDIPKNLIDKNREYLEDIKNSVLIETIFIVSRSIKFKIYQIFRPRK